MAKILTTQQSVNSTIKSIADIMRRSNLAGAMEYVPEISWLLFLRILDEREQAEQEEAEMMGLPYTPSLVAPYRWRDWASPDGAKRQELQAGKMDALFPFLQDEGVPPDPNKPDDKGKPDGLFPYLRKLGDAPAATPRQKIISRIMANVRQTRLDTEFNLWEVLDKIHQISETEVDDTHVFLLSQVFEGLLLKMGEKRNDGGQFFTPREVIRVMIEAVAPQLGKTIYDPACGTGGFLAQAYLYLQPKVQTPAQLTQLKERSFYGCEKDNTIFPIALANLVLHGIDHPNLWHGNRLTGGATYDGLFTTAPDQYDYIFANPPFGGKEGKNAQRNFDYQTSSTQVLYLQHFIATLAANGVCAVVLDEGVLFRTNEDAFVKSKRKLLNECRVEAIVSLPGGVFTAAGAGVKTNIVIFAKGERTERIWYYDLSHLKIRKRTPLTRAQFDHFFEVFPNRDESEFSWWVDMDGRVDKAKEEAEPFYEEAAVLEEKLAAYTEEQKAEKANLAGLKKALRKAKKGQAMLFGESVEQIDANINATDARIAKLKDDIKALNKEARQLRNKGKAIEDAVYDLKAVNPNTVVEEDTRTPDELIAIIEAKGGEVAKALALLKG